METSIVGNAWSPVRLGFTLVTHGDDQYVVYCDDQRRMTLAHRTLGSDAWDHAHLPEQLKKDNHNYLTMAVDAADHLHVAGNMHAVPMIYFRSARPGDIHSMQRIEPMVGPEDEQKCTYPIFIAGPSGELIFRYRSGFSGGGNDIYNVYNPDTQSWSRLLDQPLLAGGKERNAYATRPIVGPDGCFHMAWVWREPGGASACNSLSYARSRDLRRWENGAGEQLVLPITRETGQIIDPVPVGGGIINNNVQVGFDAQDRPIVTYQKYDEVGNTQIYHARIERGRWARYKTSDWENFRWDLDQRGSIDFRLELDEPVQVQADGRMTLRFERDGQAYLWALAPETLKPSEQLDPAAYRVAPAALLEVESDFPEMEKRLAFDQGDSGEPGVRYIMTWETLPAGHARREPPLPEPSQLRVHKLTA